MYHKIFENQIWHLLALISIVFIFYFLSLTSSEITQGTLFDIDTSVWLWIVVSTPIIHQRLLLLSEAAILVALLNHVYIWVHYYTVEQPDMR